MSMPREYWLRGGGRVKVDPLGQSEGVINVEDWAEIGRLHKSEGLAIKAIARQVGVARNTVRAAVALWEHTWTEFVPFLD